MRNFITWTLSILLGFEPAVLAQGQAEQRAVIVKAWIEESQIAQKPTTVRELYQRASKDMPEEKLKDFKKFVDQYGDRQLPKMDVSKVSGPNGREFYRMQGAADGKAITVEFFHDGTHPVRVNGKVLTHEDFSNVRQLMSAMGVPVKALNEYFPRKPASVGKFFSVEQLNQFKDEERNHYLKQIRYLMESMEAVDNSMNPQSTSKIENLNHFEMIAMILQGEMALATTNNCIAAGHVVVGGMKKGAPCGTDPQGKVHELYRKDKKGNPRCSNPKQIFCNEIVYMNEKTLCVDAGPDSTKSCNKLVDDKNTMKALSGTKLDAKEGEKFLKAIQTETERVASVCNENFPDGFDAVDGSSGSLFPAQEAKAKKKGSSKKATSKDMMEEQRQNCKDFQDRLDDIKGFCANYPDIKAKYPGYCGDEKPAPTTPSPVAPPVAPVTPVADQCQGLECCDKLGNDRGTDPGACESSGGSRTKEDKKCFNLQTKQQEIVYKCECNNGLAGKMKCNPLKQITEDEPFREDKKKKKKKDDDINWLIVGGVGLGLMWFMYDMQKKSLPEIYKPYEPTPQNPPVPPPVTPPPGPAAPVPRGAI